MKCHICNTDTRLWNHPKKPICTDCIIALAANMIGYSNLYVKQQVKGYFSRLKEKIRG